MNKSVVLGLAAVFLVACGSGPSADAQEPQPRSVSVSGVGEVEATPDAAYISMAIEARHKNLSAAQDEVDGKVKSFLKLVDDLDIDRKFVKTVGKNVRPEYEWDDKARKRHHIGYYVDRQLQVDLRDLDKLGALLHRAVESGVNQVSPPQLRSTQERELRRQALARAAEDAQANAEVLAKALDAKLGEVRQISAQNEVYHPQPVYRMAAMKMEAAGDMAAEQTYESGQIRFTTNVSATFDLK